MRQLRMSVFWYTAHLSEHALGHGLELGRDMLGIICQSNSLQINDTAAGGLHCIEAHLLSGTAQVVEAGDLCVSVCVCVCQATVCGTRA